VETGRCAKSWFSVSQGEEEYVPLTRLIDGQLFALNQLTKMYVLGMTIEYACAFGISSSVPGLEVGDQVNALYDGLTIVTIHGKDGRVFWFVIKKLEKKYTYPDSVRFSAKDANQLCRELVGVRVLNDITFGRVWEKKEVVSMTALEENIFRTWHYDRLVCLGDSIHKVSSTRRME
jgi:FAD dependent monooxygenase